MSFPAIPGKSTPFWSVIIPTYNPRADYLEQTLNSVLAQDVGPEQMQIEVVDDCSPAVAVEEMVKAIAGSRVVFSKTPKNSGLAGCWNTCIKRAQGEWVHILHQDDYVLPGFYQVLAKTAARHPEVSLLATRSFFVDAKNVILGVTGRLGHLENGGRTVADFFYSTPIQCPGVVVKRNFYETFGGFRSDLIFSLDCEMWARVIGSAGGLITSEVLSCYRKSDINETARLSQTAENLRDLEQMSRLFAQTYPEFDVKKAIHRVCHLAIDQAERFAQIGNLEAAKLSLNYWKANAPVKFRLRRLAGSIAKNLFK